MESAVALKPVRLPARPAQQWNLDILEKDARKRRYFIHLAHHYSGLLHSTLTSLQQLLEIQNVVYLIDADVVSHWVEVRYRDSKLMREALGLFSMSTFEYALPFGAFLEIVAWLRNLSPDSAAFLEDDESKLWDGDSDRSAVIRRLARSFRVSYRDTDDDESIARRLMERFGRQRLIFERVIRFLTAPNFRGVVRDYGLDDVRDFYRLLALAPRSDRDVLEMSDSQRRSQLDYRDAINLATVAKSMRSAQPGAASQKPTERQYILLTQTHAILDLPEHLQALHEDEALRLSELLGIDGETVGGVYPVMSPRQAFIAEDIRARRGLDHDVIESVVKQQRAFDEFGDVLREIDHPRIKPIQGFSHLPSTTTDGLERCFGHLISIYGSESDVYRRLERRRAMESSFTYHEITQRGSGRPPADLELETTSLIRVLRRLHSKINEISPVEYTARLTMDADVDNVVSISIASTMPTENLIEGELYSIPDNQPENVSVLRWLTSCTEQHFLKAISNILELRAGSGPRADYLLELHKLDAFTEHWIEGLLLYSSLGVFGAHLEAVMSSDKWTQLTIRNFRDAILAASGIGASEPRSVDSEPIIYALRIATKNGDFQLELCPPNTLDRHVSVLTHQCISRQVASLCEATSLSDVFPIKLCSAIDQVFASFAPKGRNG
jgi:hypothetical protein